jgi:hypothetical protein
LAGAPGRAPVLAVHRRVAAPAVQLVAGASAAAPSGGGRVVVGRLPGLGTAGPAVPASAPGLAQVPGQAAAVGGSRFRCGRRGGRALGGSRRTLGGRGESVGRCARSWYVISSVSVSLAGRASIVVLQNTDRRVQAPTRILSSNGCCCRPDLGYVVKRPPTPTDRARCLRHGRKKILACGRGLQPSVALPTLSGLTHREKPTSASAEKQTASSNSEGKHSKPGSSSIGLDTAIPCYRHSWICNATESIHGTSGDDRLTPTESRARR